MIIFDSIAGLLPDGRTDIEGGEEDEEGGNRDPRE